MAHNVIMPQMGESVAEGTIVRWLKAVGDSVDRDEPIFEITTDKVDAEIPAPEAGVLLEIKVGAGETVEVGVVVAVIGEAGESTGTPAPSETAAAEPEATDVAVSPSTTTAGISSTSTHASAAELRRTKSTPVVRKIAQANNINIGDVTGTGLDGRVTKKDILAFIDAGGAAAAAPVMSTTTVQAGIPMKPVKPRENDRVEPMSKMRRVISDRMIESLAYSAHVHTCFEVDYSQIDSLRRKYKSTYAERGGRLTFTTFLAKATISALQRHPIINASHDGQNVVYRGDINLGIAVALDWGLIVPVIKSADDLSLLALSKQIADKGERARSKKLAPDEVSGLTFSITNPGIFGCQWGTPIIPQPSVAILGVGTIEKRAKVVTLPDGSDSIAIKTCGYITLGFDHRVIDGAVADQFMGDIKRMLENFDESAM